MPLPTEINLMHEDTSFRVRFDYDRGEPQWFDARAGVGSPGYEGNVSITEVDFGDGWKSPDAFPQLDLDSYETEVMAKLAELESSEQAACAEAEYAQRDQVFEW